MCVRRIAVDVHGASLPAGESRTGQITLRLPSSHVGDFEHRDRCRRHGRSRCANNTSVSTVQVVHEADLAIVKTLLTDPIVPGRPVVYTLDITNNGPSSATGLLVSDTLADGTTFDPAGSDPNVAKPPFLPRASPLSGVHSATSPSGRRCVRCCL